MKSTLGMAEAVVAPRHPKLTKEAPQALLAYWRWQIPQNRGATGEASANINPFVASALEAAAAGSMSRVPSAPRTRGAAPTATSSTSAATSSFGMSGVNAHAVVRVEGSQRSVHQSGTTISASWGATWNRHARRFAYYPVRILYSRRRVMGTADVISKDEVFQLDGSVPALFCVTICDGPDTVPAAAAPMP